MVSATLRLKMAYSRGKKHLGQSVEDWTGRMLFMKLMTKLSVAGVTILLGVFAAGGQDTSTQPTRDGTVIVPERPTAVDANVSSAATVRPARPDLRPGLPPQVQVRVERFKLDARSYLAQQEALKKQLQGANDEQRALIRERLSQLREQWLERARDLRQEYKERKAELENKLRDHKELFDELRNNATEQLRDARDETRRPVD